MRKTPRHCSNLGYKNPKTLSGIETALVECVAFLMRGTKTLKPYQGLKRSDSSRRASCPTRGTKTLKPYQELKLKLRSRQPASQGHKNPKTLSGIETV